jgi:hypothetical protein
MPVDYLYILCLMFVVLAARGLFSGSLLRPSVVYTLILLLYPILTLFIEVSGLLDSYWWFPRYNGQVYVEYAEIALFATAPLFAMSLFLGELPKKGKIVLSTFEMHGAERYLLWFSAFLLVIFVVFNFRNIFIGDYYHFAKETSGYAILTALDYAFYFSMLLWLTSERKISSMEKWIFIFYFIVKFMSGGRMFLVVCGLAAWVHYSAIKRPGKKIIRKAIFFIPMIIMVMAITVVVRDRSYDFNKAAWSLSQEYINSSISALNISSLGLQTANSHPMMLLDPFLSLVPSSLLDRDSFENTKVIANEFGGNDSFAPAGGMYLPHMIYLIFPSKWFVMFYYAGITTMLFLVERSLFSTRDVKINLYKYISSIGILSIFLVFSIRHYFFVHVKTLLIILIINLFSIAAALLCSFLLRKSGNSFGIASKKSITISR